MKFTSNDVAVDTETTGVEFHDRAFVASTCIYSNGKYISKYFDLEKKRDNLFFMREISTRKKIFHNAKFDLIKLKQHGLPTESWDFEDTEGMAHILDEHRKKGLEYLAVELCDMEPWKDELKPIIRKLGRKISDGFYGIPEEYLSPYAKKDAEGTLRIYHKLFPQLLKDKQLLELYEKEKELTRVLIDVETAGLKIDIDYVEDQIKVLGQKYLEIELRTRDISGDEKFNPNSNPKIREYFEAKGHVHPKYDKYTLPEIDDPMAEAILELRNINKNYSTYFKPMQNLVGKDHVLHANFKQYKPVTGRMASGKVEER